jgi:hypothetical protein
VIAGSCSKTPRPERTYFAGLTAIAVAFDVDRFHPVTHFYASDLLGIV